MIRWGSSMSRLIKRKALPGHAARSASAREGIGCLPDLLSWAGRDVDKVGKVEALAGGVGERIASARRGHHGRGQIQLAVLGRRRRRALHPGPVCLDRWRSEGVV